jgi:hypothetical protein
MGCDVHVHVEVKLKNHDGWHHYSAPYVYRNYELFGHMAGVRSDIEPIKPPQYRIPKDASPVTKADYEAWGDDAHTATWLGWEDATKLETWGYFRKVAPGDQPLFGYVFGERLETMLEYRGAFPYLEDLRIVFWFDN